MAFEYTQRVRFYQADPAGVLFFGRLFELIETTYEELYRSAGLDVTAWLRSKLEFGTPIVHVEADFSRPMEVDEEVTVRVEIERIGTSSLSLAYTILGDEGDLKATARVVHAFVDHATWRPIPVPDDVRAKLEALRDRA